MIEVRPHETAYGGCNSCNEDTVIVVSIGDDRHRTLTRLCDGCRKELARLLRSRS